MISYFSPLSMTKPIHQPSVPTLIKKSQTDAKPTEPPLNSPSSKRTPLQELQTALATLNVETVRNLADYLEALDRKGEVCNDRFGLYGVWQVSKLPLNDPLWNEIKWINDYGLWERRKSKKLNIRPEYRQMIKDMCARIIDPKNQALMNDAHGGDGIFEPGELGEWLVKNQKNGSEPDSKAFDTFYTSIKRLNTQAGVDIMEFLEKQDNPNTIRDNKRFGMRGVQMLSRLTPASQEWEASGNGQVNTAFRQQLIDAAKVLMNSDYALWAFQVHQGDMIFEPDDMRNWLNFNKILKCICATET